MTTILSFSALFRMMMEAASTLSGSVGYSTRSEKLFKNLLDQYGDMIARICLGYSRTREEFEDLRQNAYINIWKGLGTFRNDSSVKTWIYRVTLNSCVSILRKNSKESFMVDLAQLPEIVDGDSEKMELIQEMYELINQLSTIDRAIVMLWLDEYSYEDISQLVGLPRNTIATRLRRAKEKMHKYEREY